MSPRVVRLVVVAICVAGIAGMIVTSIADSTGGALTFGLVTAVAVLGLILVTAVTGGPVAPEGADALAERVEAQVERLVVDGASEADVRRLVGDAVHLGRLRRPEIPARNAQLGRRPVE